MDIASRTLDRACAKLKVVPFQSWENGRNLWYWRIAQGATAEEELAQLVQELKKGAGEERKSA